MRKHLVLAAALMLVFGGQAWMPATGAATTLIFEDNFDSENGGNYQLNYNGFAHWTVSEGTVDLIGLGSPWDWFGPERGLYVDMDGSTWDAGIMTSLFTLEPGSYLLEFDLAGNHRVATNESVIVRVGMGSLASASYSLDWDVPFQTYSLAFGVDNATQVALQFKGMGRDNIGLLLDNVKLSMDPAPVPEPATLLLLGTGLLGLSRFRKKPQA